MTGTTSFSRKSPGNEVEEYKHCYYRNRDENRRKIVSMETKKMKLLYHDQFCHKFLLITVELKDIHVFDISASESRKHI